MKRHIAGTKLPVDGGNRSNHAQLFIPEKAGKFLKSVDSVFDHNFIPFAKKKFIFMCKVNKVSEKNRQSSQNLKFIRKILENSA